MARFGPTSIGSPKHSVLSAGGCTTPTHAAPRVPFLQRRITNPCLIKLQFRDRLCIHIHRGRPLIIPGFCCQVCRLVKPKLGDCLYCFWSNQLLCIRLHRW